MPARVAVALAVAAATGSCGYAFTQRYVARGGVDRVHVGAFENLSTDTGLGAALTSALRTELARRGADGGAGAPARIEGDVRAGESRPTVRRSGPDAGVETWRISLVVRARLVRGDSVIEERELRREADFLGGGDPLETEGRRALALRRTCADAAREILRSFEDPR